MSEGLICKVKVDPSYKPFLQNGVVALKDGRLKLLELQVRMLLLNAKLRKVPDDVDNPAAHSALLKGKQVPRGVKLSYSMGEETRTFAPKVTSFSTDPFIRHCLHYTIMQDHRL